MKQTVYHLSAAAFCLSAASASAESQVLHVYNWSDYIGETTVQEFTDQTGIDVVYDFYESNEVLEAKLLAGSSGYDVVVPSGDFLQRQAAIGIFQPLDKSKIPNWANLDQTIMNSAAVYDPGNTHAIVWAWGTTGIGYNVDMVRERLGDDYVVNSWDLVFKPEIIAKLADCGVMFLDSPTNVMPTALNYLGLNPNSTSKEDLEAAADLLSSVRPHVRAFDSAQYLNDLASGEICAAIGWNGDVFIAQARAEEAGSDVNISYVIPNEGAYQWMDMMAIPADAPNPEAAHAFINFVLEAKVGADFTNTIWYANANEAAIPLIDEDILSNTGIYPSAEAKSKLWANQVKDKKTDRLLTRLWTEIKTNK